MQNITMKTAIPILVALKRGRTLTSASKEVGRTHATIHQELRILENNGLIKRLGKHGREVFYSVKEDKVARLIDDEIRLLSNARYEFVK